MLQNFLPKKNEIIEQSIMFGESIKAFGFKADVLIPRSINIPDIGYKEDILYEESDRFSTYLSFDRHPQSKLLRSLGWNIEDSSVKPLVCYIPRYLQVDENLPRDPNSNVVEILPTEYTLIDLEYSYEDGDKSFIVTKVSSSSFNPIYYILLITPYRHREPDNPIHNQNKNLDLLNIDDSTPEFRFLNKVRETDVDTKY